MIMLQQIRIVRICRSTATMILTRSQTGLGNRSLAIHGVYPPIAVWQAPLEKRHPSQSNSLQ